jgi:hypothetical protein
VPGRLHRERKPMVRGKFQNGHDVSCRGAQYHGSRLNGEALVFERNGGRPLAIAGEKHTAGKIGRQLAKGVSEVGQQGSPWRQLEMLADTSALVARKRTTSRMVMIISMEIGDWRSVARRVI